ncbi:MAG: hypothetical protein MI919_04680, partial [Holophagales bacterium]|nr:hypothetical protein [Holophagales bacterium]
MTPRTPELSGYRLHRQRNPPRSAVRPRLADACSELAVEDPPSRLAILITLGTVLVCWSLPLSYRVETLVGKHLASLALIGTFLWALRRDRKRIRERAERIFWRELELVAATFASAVLLFATGTASGHALPLLLGDLVMLVGFSFLILAIERQPHRGGYGRALDLERKTSLLAVSTLVIWLAGYFAVIPRLLLGSTSGSSAMLFGALGSIVLVRLAWLALRVEDPRWHSIYRLFTLMGLAILLLFARHNPAWQGWLGAVVAHTSPLAWLLPSLIATFATRMRTYPFPVVWRPSLPEEEILEESPVGYGSRILLLPMALPVLHFAFHRGAFLDP